MQRLPVDDRVHSREVGHRAGVKFTVHVDKGAVVARVVRAHRLAALLLQDRIIAGVYAVVTAHWLERVRRAHQQRVRVRLDEDANVVLAILLGRALHQAHLHVTVGRVPSQPLLLGQISQAQIVHEISETDAREHAFNVFARSFRLRLVSSLASASPVIR